MATAKPKNTTAANPGLKIASRSLSGFRRHGHTFTPEGKLIPYSELTQEQVDAFNAERQLIVSEVDIDAEAARMAGLPPVAAT